MLLTMCVFVRVFQQMTALRREFMVELAAAKVKEEEVVRKRVEEQQAFSLKCRALRLERRA